LISELIGLDSSQQNLNITIKVKNKYPGVFMFYLFATGFIAGLTAEGLSGCQLFLSRRKPTKVTKSFLQ